MDSAEGGAAALGIILNYYHKYIPLAELRYQCGVSRDGCNANNLMAAAKYYDLDVNSNYVNLDDLKKLECPCILQWKNNHFVVLEGFTKEHVHINDPATGPRKIDYSELLHNYSGMSIHVRPSDRFKKGESEPSFISLIWDRVKTISLTTWIILFFLQVAVILLGLLPPSFSRIFIDKFLGSKLWEWKWLLLTTMIFIMILQAWSGISGYVALKIRRKFSYYFSAQFLDHILKLPVLYFMQRHGAEVISRMSLNQSISGLLTGHLAAASINLFLIAIYGFVIFRYDPLIASVGIMASLLNMGMFIAISRARSNNYNRLKQETAQSLGVAVDTLQNIESIKTMGNDTFSFMRVVGNLTKKLNNYQEIGKKDVFLTTMASFINNLANIGLLGLGCLRVMEGHLSIGMLLALQMLMSLFLAPLNDLIQFGMQIQTLKIDLLRINDVLKNPLDPLILAQNKSKEAIKLKGKVELESITFGYSPLDKPLIEDFNLRVEEGESVAFVGATGSGKSTLAKIICGILRPWKGEVRYDDVLLKDVSQNELRYSLGWVDQDIFLFSGSVFQNLSLWDSSITMEQITKATQDACIYDEIMSKEGGFDFILSEGGSNISHGQKQRLEIARALLLNPTILILDEATSALDSFTEQKIIQNIRNRKITCILVAHRLSTIKMCDRIIVLNQGKIVQTGIHEELKELKGYYQTLVKTYQEAP